MKSDTPRTDALEAELHLQDHVKVISLMTAHARQLERELNDTVAALRASTQRLERYRERIDLAEKERTRQQQILDALNQE